MSDATTHSARSDPVSARRHLVLIFEDCPDFRADNDNKAHLLSDIIVIARCAVLGGANAWTAVERFGEGHETWFRSFLKLENGIPSHDTFQRVFARLNPDVLNSRFGGWMAEICGELTLKHIASDGKTMRGSADNKGRLKGRHVGHAFATANGVCLAQKVTAEKSNEITAIPELLKLLDLKKAIVAIDAMGCPREIAAAIVDGQGDHLLAVKGNQGHLYEDVQATLAPMLGGETVPTEAEYAKTENVSRGREEKRICYVSTQREHIRNQAL